MHKENWFAPTHHDHLVKHHGLDPDTVLLVPCACGLEARRADYMVDVTALPPHVRMALGIENVDYLCDGCTTRIFREQHMLQADFNAALGAPPENIALVQPHDEHHALGIANRHESFKPAHGPVSHDPAKAKAATHVTAPLPLRFKTLRHENTLALHPGHFKDNGTIVKSLPAPNR